jgi:hypothetical protein
MGSTHTVSQQVANRKSVSAREAQGEADKALKQVSLDLREIRKKAPHTHKEDQQVVISI